MAIVIRGKKGVRRSLPMQRGAQELGYLSIYWSWIEDAINVLIRYLTPLEEGDVANAILGNTDVRGKIQMAKALAFLRKSDDLWFDTLIAALDRIDNDIRVRRNRYVHSSWYTPRGRLTRKRLQVKLHKPQARQLALTTSDSAPTSLKELRQLQSDMIRELRVVMACVAFMSEGGAASRSTPFPLFLRLIGPSARRRGRARSTR